MHQLYKNSRIKIPVFIVIILVNYLSLWHLLASLEINGIHPIGYSDSFGLVFPPNWFLLIVSLISIAEFVALNTFFPLRIKN